MRNVYITILFHCGPTNLANPFVIVHPDLPPDAALGQRFEMMFVVGLNSNGISNQIQISGTGTAEVTLFLNSTVVNTERSLTKLPFSLQYKMPISTVSNGNYTITVRESVHYTYFTPQGCS